MITTDRFVFLHLHKSGGTFVNDLLLRFLPDARQVGYHLPYRLVPPAAARLPVLGVVRNPWSYYVSWYAFQSRRVQPNALFQILSSSGTLDFEHTVANLLNLGADSPHLDAVLAALPPQYTNRGLNLPGFALAPIRASGRGFYSYLFRYLFEGATVVHVRRMDRLREELPMMLTAVGQPVSTLMRAYIQDAPARNASEHAAASGYYGEALRDLVAERDAEIITRFGYRFEG